ncbi:MAG: phosphoribosylglycinamide formyltransferase [Candidatus Hydrogenedentes bacterium]|nr:phosphoribosylglycinamide formyltransferase [Candidatus Hydrogenedentota bacterium]
MPIRLAILLSGSGTTLQNLIDHINDGKLDATISIVISSKPNAYGLIRAQQNKIPTAIVSPKNYPDFKTFNEALWKTIRQYPVDLVVLAGFLSLIEVPPDFTNRIMNIHPALIPAFCGKGMYGHHVHEAVIKSGVKITGCTVHFVDEQYDHGPIILQEAVPVFEDDTPETLAERVQAKEREIYPKAIQLFAEGRLKVEGNKVKILPAVRKETF